MIIPDNLDTLLSRLEDRLMNGDALLDFESAIYTLAKEIKAMKDDQIRIFDLASLTSSNHAKCDFILNKILELKQSIESLDKRMDQNELG